ncbi:MAG: hypothetical protein M3Q95_05775 [Bacteroidota bacterium]|nr:hypothetical protein [Bacteroidota bacterium]
MTPDSRIAALLEFLKEDPADAETKYMLALEYIKSGNDSNALVWMNNLHQSHPDYLPNYYHYGKLLERTGASETAMMVYLEGMNKAKSKNDMHTHSELQGAREMME